MKVAIIGCGNIGTEIGCYLIKQNNFALISLTDADESKILSLRKKIKRQISSASLSDAVRKSDLIIEAANKNVVKEILSCKDLDRKGKKLLVMSTGGLFENLNLLKRIKHCEIHIPSGAIAGLDAIQAVVGEIDSLNLLTIKSPKSFENSSFVAKKKIKLSSLKKRTIIFQGNLKEAINGFSQNINVAASLYLASKFNGIKISIIADPKTKFNTHIIICKGKFGVISTRTENLPSKNPKTSYLAIQSAISILKNISSNFKVGN